MIAADRRVCAVAFGYAISPALTRASQASASAKSASAVPGGRTVGGAPSASAGDPWVGAEEPYVRADATQSAQRLAEPYVGDVAGAVEEEQISAESLAGRARLDTREVHTTDGQLGEHGEQRTDPVVCDVDGERSDVVAGRHRWRTGPADQRKPRHGIRVVANLFGQHGKPVPLRTDRCAHRRRELSVGDGLGRGGVGQRVDDGGIRQVAREPSTALRRGLRMGSDGR